jgi:hypothetical protein
MAEENSTAQSQFLDNMTTALRAVREKATDEEYKGIVQNLETLRKTNPNEFVSAVQGLSDEVKMVALEKSGATPAGTAVNTWANTATLGGANAAAAGIVSGVSQLAPLAAKVGINLPSTDKSFSQLRGELDDETRLRSKMDPAAATIGTLAGVVTPGPASAVAAAGAKLGGAVLAGAGKVAGIAARAGGASTKLAAAAESILGQHFIPQTIAQGAGAMAAFEGAREGVNSTLDVATGQKTVGQAVKDTGGAIARGAVEGGEAAALLGGGLYAVGKTAQALSTGAQAGARWVGKNFLGKDIKYQLDNVELIRQAVEKTPDVVFAESANAIQPAVRRVQDQLRSIEMQSKDELVKIAQKQQMKLTGDFQATTGALSQAVENLRQAAQADVAIAARNLNDQLWSAYGQINARYGQKLDAISATATNPVNYSGVLDFIQKEMQGNKAMDASGRLLSESQWARTNPEAFQRLSDYWQRLGGEVRMAGGKDALNVNLRDALNFKKEVGEAANFGTIPNNTDRIIRNVYNRVREATETAEPRLKPINQEYAANRSVIDDVRSKLGRQETTIAAKLRRVLSDNKNLTIREALEGFGAVSEKGLEASQQALSASDRVALLSKFKSDPRKLFSQVKQAYLNDDPFLTSAFENLAKQRPQLAPYVANAKRQAESLKAAVTEQQARSAFRDNQALSQVAQAMPQADPIVARAQAARQRAQELQQVLPQDRLQLEQALASSQFAATPNQQAIVQDFVKQNPELAAPVQESEAARVAQRLQKGQVEKGALEELPVLGQTLFALRKAVTPSASRFFNMIGNGSPKTRRALIDDLFEHVQGSEVIPKAAVARMRAELGPEAALVIYAQNGGAQDLANAAESLSAQFGGDGEIARKNQPRK